MVSGIFGPLEVVEHPEIKKRRLVLKIWVKHMVNIYGYKKGSK